jgi:hypothetical protein
MVIFCPKAAERGVQVVNSLQQIGGKDCAFRADRGEMLTMAKLHKSKRTKLSSMWDNVTMATATVSTITALQAQAAANYFLLTQLGDRLVADDPMIDTVAGVWRAPVLLSYPGIGPIGQVGEILINATAEEIVSHTPIEEMKAAAIALYEQHRNEIEAPLP